ncbi:Exonuclease VII, small subunit [Methanoregula boonei 6A8]|uniref:Exonuclease VII, small subunit n=2 Tax=Methanoregula TaxID=395331 RepID=A7I9J8_METB6|nr:Exonuclease VII, small subunit [Methanoregula boonei 6A8]
MWTMTGTYEEKIEELRQIIAKIEDGTTSLDESMKLYEQGAALVKQCETLLADAEEKITTLARGA